jgi:hypothetical protein
LQGEVVLLGELPPEFWGQGAFEVHVEFDFGEAVDEWVVCGSDLLFPGLESGIWDWWFHLAERLDSGIVFSEFGVVKFEEDRNW